MVSRVQPVLGVSTAVAQLFSGRALRVRGEVVSVRTGRTGTSHWATVADEDDAVDVYLPATAESGVGALWTPERGQVVTVSGQVRPPPEICCRCRQAP